MPVRNPFKTLLFVRLLRLAKFVCGKQNRTYLQNFCNSVRYSDGRNRLDCKKQPSKSDFFAKKLIL